MQRNKEKTQQKLLEELNTIKINSVDERVTHYKDLQYKEHQQLFVVLYTDIHKAASDNSVSGIIYFLKYHKSKIKVHVDDFDKNGNCAIHLAAEKGCNDAIKCLLKHGSSVNIRNSSGNTPLMFACKENMLDSILLLIEFGADSKLTNQSGFNCIHYAAQCDNGTAISTLINALNEKEKKKRLLLLEQDNDEQSTDSTHNKSSSVASITSFESSTFLNHFYNAENISVSSSIQERQSENCNEVNFIINMKANNGSTPLHIACLFDAIKSMKVLLLNYVVVNVNDNANETALHKAARNSFFEAYKLLVNHGGNPNSKNFLNETPSKLLN
jgi:ankyrin repeat protein